MEIWTYILILFVLANLFYFLFSDEKETKRKFWLTVSVFSIILLIIAVFLSLISSDSLIDNTVDFFTFIISATIITIMMLSYHLKIHQILNDSPMFSKNYIRYIFSFSFFSFFINIVFFIILFIILSLIFDVE